MAARRGDHDVRPLARRRQGEPPVLAARAAPDLLPGDVDERERRAGHRGPVRVVHRAEDGDSGPVRSTGRGDRGAHRRGFRLGSRGVVGRQGLLLEEARDEQTEDEYRHEVEEDPRHGVGVRLDVGVAQRRGQGVHELRGDGLRVRQFGSPARGQAFGQGVGEPVGEEGTEDRGADDAADLPEVVVGAGGGAEVGGAHGVLHGEDEDRHHHADPGAEDGRPDAVVQPRGVGVEAGEQPHADDGERAAEHGVELVAAGAADELAGDDRGADDAAHHRQHEQAGLGGRGPVGHLQEGRQVAGRAEQGDTDHEADQAGDVEDGVPEQPERDEGFGGEALDDQEEDGGDGRARAEAEDDAGVPGVLGATPTGEQDQAGRGGREQQGAEDVEPCPGRGLGQLQGDGDDGQGEEAEGDVDVEAPPPGEVVGEVAAQQGPGDRGEAERGADQAHEAAAFPGGDDVRDDRLNADHEAAGADALDGAVGDQLVHGLGPPGECGADDEDDDRELEDALAADEIAELAVDRQPDGGGEQIGGDGPGHPVQAVQFADDLRQRGGDDHLLQRREQQREHQREEDQPHAAGAEFGALGVVRSGGVRGCRGRFVLYQSDPAHVPLPSSRCCTIPA